MRTRTFIRGLVLGFGAVALLSTGCSDTPTELESDDVTLGEQAPVFAKGGKPGKPGGGGGGTSTIVEYRLLAPQPVEGDAGVLGDGLGAYEVLRQYCDATPRREITRDAPDGLPSTDPGFLPPVCDGFDDTRRFNVHLPGDPLNDGDGDYGDNEPSYTTNKNGKVRPTGWMRPTFNIVWACDGNWCNLVWTDGILARDESGVATITGTCAKLYTENGNPAVTEPTSDAATCPSEDKDGNPVDGFPLGVTVTVTEVTTP